MDKFIIQGGATLRGEITISGAKNSALPILAATLLVDGPSTLANVPNLADIRAQLDLLGDLGCDTRRDENGVLTAEVTSTDNSWATYDRVRKMRASISVLGPLLARRGYARVSMPGGCAIGSRPVDLHLRGLEALGAKIELDNGDIIASCDKLRGTEIFLGGAFGSTVLGTMNVLSAATLAEGTTVIESAACEPEVVDLVTYLNACGAKISGAGSPRITIEGVERLTGCDHTVIPDRIEAGTFLIAAAATKSDDLLIQNIHLRDMMALVDKLREVGIVVVPENNGTAARVVVPGEILPTDITTQPHPGFPTDVQAQMMVLLSLANGNSVLTEKIFPDRFLHVPELLRMGANIRKEGPTSIITGVDQLIGAPVMASDLRASAALVIAGLVARGETTIRRVYHIDRGYEHIETKLAACGATIRREKE
ncbi:MAG: UDP-N-acetylglucosamine 1-carboxyvinyltransferase [Phycisphaerales bacterium]|jgi:UDP-N-acetylglucosamine 1-carboxyvinyltransferase|nr:UDP-N-acetylglucosamine 1-carboxyvinyltransferase [Phycisphaerales bacterium]MBT7171102.1 UDP-N-acetylglucosamine 1-carboxyvinyltransferase [Phycisphaerales bacterium]